MSYVIKDFETGAYVAKLTKEEISKVPCGPSWSWFLCDAMKFKTEKEARHYGFVYHMHRAYIIVDYKKEKGSK